MSTDLEQARRALPLPALMAQLGLGAHAKKSCKCPFHDDGTNSFSVHTNGGGRYYWKCFVGCGGGDEIDMIVKARGVSKGEAIRQYGEMAGANGATAADACVIFGGTVVKARARATPVVAAKLEPLPPKAIDQLAAWRGYSREFCEWLNSKGLIGLHENQIAFPVTDGLHYRVKGKGWRYTEGAKVSLFVLGLTAKTADIHCFESQWDALAFADVSKERHCIVSTRGASNIATLAERLAGHEGTIFVWPQNDRYHIPESKWPKIGGVPMPPSEKWTADIRNALSLESIKVVTTPTLWKDLNQWTKDAAPVEVAELSRCIAEAKDLFVGVAEQKVDASAGSTKTALEPRGIVQSRLAHVGSTPTPDTNLSAVPALEKLGEVKGLPFESATPDEAQESATISRDSLARVERPVSDSCGGGQFISITSADAILGAEVATRTDITPAASEKQEATSASDSDAQRKAGANTSSAEIEQLPQGILDGAEAGSSPAAAETLAITLDNIADFLRRFVSFPSDQHATVIALWIAHTWIWEAFRWTPYLVIRSPEKRCGKSTLLSCLKYLACRAWAVSAPTPAALYRYIEVRKPTALIDEYDTLYNDKVKSEGMELLRNVLNVGWERGTKIPRCDGKDNKLIEFEPYCPKALAGIGRLPDTIEDRAIAIELSRQSNDEAAQEFDEEEAEEIAAPLIKALSDWSAGALTELKRVKPERPPEMNHRQKNFSRPLLAIADAAGLEWGIKARRALVLLLVEGGDDSSSGTQLLSSIRDIFTTKGTDALATDDLLNALIAVETADAPWVQWWENDMKRNNVHGPRANLAKRLKGYHIKPSPIDGDFDTVGYHRNDFKDAWTRYLPAANEMTTMALL